MRKGSVFVLFLAAALIGAVPTQECRAIPINGGFENGLDSWLSDLGSLGIGLTEVTDLHLGDDPSNPLDYYAKEGSYFAALTAGDLMFDNTGSPVPGSRETTLSQMFVLDAGASLGGWAAFDALDYGSFQDYAFVRIFDQSGTTLIATPWFDQIKPTDPPEFDHPWTHWSWNAPAAGTYTLSLGVANWGDDPAFPAPWNSSVALFDGIGPAAIPEPSTFFLLGSALFVAGLMRRRRKAL